LNLPGKSYDRNTQIIKQDNADYLHKDLTQKIIGAAFTVYNTLGYSYREKEFQRPYAAELEKLVLKFQREVYCYLKYEDKIISKFF